MELAAELARHKPRRGSLLTIGVFDGVHLGHQHLVRRLVERARQEGLASGVVTFLQHPRVVLSPRTRLPYLTGLEERCQFLRDLGVGFIVSLSFTEEVARLGAREFISLLQEHLGMRGLVIGPDFALGRGREGDAAALTALGEGLGFSVEVVPPLVSEGVAVSSTAVRHALARGEMDIVIRLLGRPYRIEGKIVSGEGRGRGLGFPTANILVDADCALPGDGVYVTRAFINGETYKSATNVGRRPTFDPGERMVEVFVIDYEGDLYGRRMSIEFVERLRDEVRFASPEELAAQIEKDVARTRAILEDR